MQIKVIYFKVTIKIKIAADFKETIKMCQYLKIIKNLKAVHMIVIMIVIEVFFFLFELYLIF